MLCSRSCIRSRSGYLWPPSWGFGIGVVYPALEFPERELFDEPGGPPPEEMIVEETVSPQESEGKAKEPPPKGPPAFEPEFQEYHQELAEHNRIGSAIALGASVLTLVAALIPAVGRRPDRAARCPLPEVPTGEDRSGSLKAH